MELSNLRTGRPKVGQGRVCTMETKAFLVHPSQQGVCGRHGMEDDDVTHGDLVMSEIRALEGQVGKESRRDGAVTTSSKEARQFQ